MTSPNIQPSPDISAYVDLRIYDVSDQEIVDTGLAAAQLNLPGWVPREGNTEVVLMESLALETSEGVVAINRLPGAVLAALLLMAGVDKDFGAAPEATATFTLGDTLGHTIPAGTRLYLMLDDGSTVTFLVAPPDGLIIDPGDSTGTVEIIGDEFTAAANGIAAGVTLVMADPVPFIDSVALATDVADGRDPETDDEWRDRGVARLSRLSDALVLPRHFEAAALEDVAVARAVALDLWDGSGGAPGDDPGHITVAVLGDGGVALSAPAKAAIETSLEERAVAILDVHVIDVTIVTVPVAVQVHVADGFDSAEVTQAVEDAVTAYIDPLVWTWGGTIRRFELVSLVDRVDGVDYVMTLTINGVAADYTVTGAASLPKAGVVTVTTG